MTAPTGAQQDEEIQRILEERAAALARPPRGDVQEETVDVLVMSIGGERYGLELRYIREVQPVGSLTAVPGLPAIWAGIASLRGVLHPVLDAPVYLGVGGASEEPRYVVVIESGEVVVSLLVDDLMGLRSIAADEIEPPLEMEAHSHRKAVSGVSSELLLLLDAETLLEDPTLVVNEETS